MPRRSTRESEWQGAWAWWVTPAFAVAIAVAVLIPIAFRVGPSPVRADELVVVQMNLCNSGMARNCYSFGAAVDDAATNIGRLRPDLVTVQEVCRDDIQSSDGAGTLAQAMTDLYGADQVVAAFVPARRPSTGEPVRCLNGEEFGVALLYRHWLGGDGGPDRPHGALGDAGEQRFGWFDSQDAHHEIRAWVCATIIPSRLTGCTTHLSSTDPDIALQQCRELMEIVRSPWAMPEVVIAGDLNLNAGTADAHDLRNCTGDMTSVTDGAVQHVLASPTIEVVDVDDEEMTSTDHPLLNVKLRLPPATPIARRSAHDARVGYRCQLLVSWTPPDTRCQG